MIKTPQQLRSDFETGLLFDELGGARPISWQRRPDGDYESPGLQMAWLGYQMCAKYAHDVLKRYDPERYITTGMVTAYEDGGIGDNPENQIRRALQVCGGTPV